MVETGVTEPAERTHGEDRSHRAGRAYLWRRRESHSQQNAPMLTGVTESVEPGDRSHRACKTHTNGVRSQQLRSLQLTFDSYHNNSASQLRQGSQLSSHRSTVIATNGSILQVPTYCSHFRVTVVYTGHLLASNKWSSHRSYLPVHFPKNIHPVIVVYHSVWLCTG